MPISIEQIVKKELGAELGRRFRLLRYEGWLRDGETGTLLVFTGREEERLSHVFKLAADPRRFPALKAEFGNLTLLAASRGRIQTMIPRALSLTHFDGLLVLAERALPGAPLKSLDAREFFLGRSREEFLQGVTDILVALGQAPGRGARAFGGDEIRRHFVEPALFFRDTFSLGDAETTMLDDYLQRVSALAGLRIPLVYSHGDFCPSNLLWESGKLSVIDWEIPLKLEVPMLDLFHFLQSCALSFTPERNARPYAERLASFFSAGGRFSPVTGDLIRATAEKLEIPDRVIPFLFVLYWLNEAIFRYRQWTGLLSGRTGRAPAPEEVFSCWAEDERRRGAPAAPIRKGIYGDFRKIAALRDKLVSPCSFR
jgi:hypothetical protein